MFHYSDPLSMVRVAQSEASNRNQGKVALSTQSGSRTPALSAGMSLMPSTPKVLDAITASSISVTPPPKTIRQTLEKLAANSASIASADIIRETAPVLMREIKKGKATALSAADALKGEPAIQYTICKQALKGASPRDTEIIRKLMANKNISTALKLYRSGTERSAVLQKQVAILSAQNSSDAMLRTQAQMRNTEAELATMEAKFLNRMATYSVSMDNPALLGCLLKGAQAEGRLAFEAKYGKPVAMPSIEIEIAEGNLPDEEVVGLVETAEILQQAADQGVGHEEGLIAPTPEDEEREILLQQQVALKDGFQKHLTPQNLLLGGLAIGLGYLLLRD